MKIRGEISSNRVKQISRNKIASTLHEFLIKSYRNKKVCSKIERPSFQAVYYQCSVLKCLTAFEPLLAEELQEFLDVADERSRHIFLNLRQHFMVKVSV